MSRQAAAARFRELGSELRRCRESAGLSGRHVSHRIGWSVSKVSRVESGHQGVNELDVLQYLGGCGVYLKDAHSYLDLAREANRNNKYWLSHSYESLIYHESTAARSFVYEPLLVHGLLQTSDYAYARMARHRCEEEKLHWVEVRGQRQQIIHRLRHARFAFFLHEQALRLVVGSPAIMHDQLLHIVLLAALDHVEVRVIPTSLGEMSAFGGSFRVLYFEENRPLVYLDTPTSGLFLDDPTFVEPYNQLVSDVRAASLDEGQSREFLADLASEYDRRSAGEHANALEEEQL